MKDLAYVCVGESDIYCPRGPNWKQGQQIDAIYGRPYYNHEQPYDESLVTKGISHLKPH